jgi:putative transposase
MPRQVRIEFEGAVYHVMCRGNRQEAIFVDAEDREVFLRTLSEAGHKHGWGIHSYVLMDNHYHLLLETPEANLVKGMTWFQTTYTVRYNARHRKRGHLFGGRYKAILVDTDGSEYFRTLMDYIHLNPVRAGIVKMRAEARVVGYPWSSLGAFGNRATKRPDFLWTERAFRVFGCKDTPAGRRRFVERVEERARAEKAEECGLAQLEGQSLQSTLRRGWCYGTDAFKEHLLELSAHLLDKRSTQSRDNYQGPEIEAHGERRAEQIVQAGLEVLGMAEEELGQTKKTAREKFIIAWKIRTETGVPLKWVSERLKMGNPANVSRATRQIGDERGKNRKLNRILKKIDARFFS